MFWLSTRLIINYSIIIAGCLVLMHMLKSIIQQGLKKSGFLVGIALVMQTFFGFLRDLPPQDKKKTTLPIPKKVPKQK